MIHFFFFSYVTNFSNFFFLEQKSKLRGIEDVDRQRLSQLSDHYKDVHDAIVWLRQNRDKFRANIYEPPAIAVTQMT